MVLVIGNEVHGRLKRNHILGATRAQLSGANIGTGAEVNDAILECEEIGVGIQEFLEGRVLELVRTLLDEVIQIIRRLQVLHNLRNRFALRTILLDTIGVVNLVHPANIVRLLRLLRHPQLLLKECAHLSASPIAK